jgi:AcrR family transcriptional regulator
VTLVRRHGWGGDPPRNEDEASLRIVATAVQLMSDTGAEITIADVAQSLGVIRQTVYRYFPSADALMKAAAMSSVGGFLDRLAEPIRDVETRQAPY